MGWWRGKGYDGGGREDSDFFLGGWGVALSNR